MLFRIKNLKKGGLHFSKVSDHTSFEDPKYLALLFEVPPHRNARRPCCFITDYRKLKIMALELSLVAYYS